MCGGSICVGCREIKPHEDSGIHGASAVIDSIARSAQPPAGEFTKFSPALHQVNTPGCEGPPAMNENIVIPIKIERVKVWGRRTLEAAAWLICLGLLAMSVAVAACGALAWLVSGSETVLAAGLGGGVLLGLGGVWKLLRRLDQAAQRLRSEAT
jgi:hypothetical protein